MSKKQAKSVLDICDANLGSKSNIIMFLKTVISNQDRLQSRGWLLYLICIDVVVCYGAIFNEIVSVQMPSELLSIF